MNDFKLWFEKRTGKRLTFYTKQEIAGYMIDYLFQKNPEALNRPVFWDCFRGEDKSIEKVYNYLIKKV